MDYVNDVLRKQPKKRVKIDYGIHDVYNHYKEKVEVGLRKPYKLFAAVLKDMNTCIMNEILLNSQEIKLPYHLGHLRIKKSKMSFRNKNNLRINWLATKKAGKKIYHTNDHRNNYKYRFLWLKGKHPGGTPYSFIPTRTNKRRLSKILQTQPEIDYHE